MFLIFLIPMLVSGLTQTFYPMPEYAFSWTADLTSGKLHTEIVLTPPGNKTFGWVGFGIAGGSGGMLGGDVFTAYANGTGCAIQDRKARFDVKELPREDTSVEEGFADWILDSCSHNGTAFTIAATRAFITDDENDLDFVTGSMELLFAWGQIQPSSPTDIKIHDGGFRPGELALWGDAVLPFDKTQFESDYDTVEFKMPAVPIGNHTSYSCLGFNLTLKEGNETNYTQAIAFEALIQPENLEYVHHIILYACSVPVATELFECTNMPPSCQSGILYAWGKGGNPFVLPKVAGLDIGIASRTYIAMQMHYNNMEDIQGLIDSSGVAIYRTNQARPNRTAYLFVGTLKTNLTYGMHQIGVSGACNETATLSWPTKGLNIYSSFIHAHQRGRRLWTVLLRNGTFISTVGNNQAYDFNLQKIVPLKPFVTLLPGDKLVTYCIYDTSKDTKNVLTGETTDDEMCINFLAFYPAFDARAHITCGVNTNPFAAMNPGPTSCVLLPDHPPPAYEFQNWTVSDWYYMSGGNATCAAGYEGTAVLSCPGRGAPFAFSGCRRKRVLAPTIMPVASTAFVPAVSAAFVVLLMFV